MYLLNRAKKLLLLSLALASLAGCGGEAGLIAHKYEGSWNNLPNFSSLTPVSQHTIFSIGTNDLGSTQYGLVLKGQLKIDQAGLYRFHLNSDDGSRLSIEDVELIVNDGVHLPQQKSSQDLMLSAGNHELRLEYFQKDGGQLLELFYQYENGPLLPVSEAMLFHTSAHTQADKNDGGSNQDHCDVVTDQPSGGDEATSSNSLATEQQLVNNEYLVSTNGDYRFYLQSDGNLVLRDWNTRASLWSSGTHGQGGVRVRLQGDGNLVLREGNGDALWSSKTAGSNADRLVLNNNGSLVIYQDNAIIWSVGNEPPQSTPADDSCDNDTNPGDDNHGGDGTTSNGRFSSPSAALYTLNDSQQRAFPKHIDTNFNGNGHSETWDGRVFVVTRSAGWFAAAFRPERIGRNSDGTPIFNQGAFGNTIPLELEVDAPDIQHNWLQIVPDPDAGIENPYPSNASGGYQSNGSYRTYKTIVYHTSRRNGDNDQMGIRRATFIISDANTRNAQLVRAEFTESFQRLRTTSGSDLRCIEPSVTLDGRLIICQGHPDNNGRIDNLVYSWNEIPNALTGWRMPESIANMYYDDRSRDIDGIRFDVRFPIAQKPLQDANGVAYERNQLVKGAYPWISHDGAELFYQASRENKSARRTGSTVVGRWTGWAFRHIDGPINRNRYQTSRLFFSSPGAFTTMWSLYKDIKDLPIPYATRGPAYPLIGSNTRDYVEVGFDDFLDGNYVMFLGMNEQLDRAGAFLKNNTPDTSGNFNNATLQGAKFPYEYNGEDELVGRHGQGIYFPNNAYLEVNKNQGWEDLAKGVTVDFHLRINNGSNNRVNLFLMDGSIAVYLANGNRLTADVWDTSGSRGSLSSVNIPANQWTHIAFSYNPNNKTMTLYVDGEVVAEKVIAGFGTLSTTGDINIGPINSQGLYLFDEVKVSNIARNTYEIAHNAFARSHRQPNQALLNQIPDHYDTLARQATAINGFSIAAAELGETLFLDELLSKQNTTSCSTCHDPSLSFTDGRAIAQGNEPTDEGTRNTPMLFNRLFSSLQGWGGNARSLDTQALVPIEAEHEMNLPIPEAVNRLRDDPFYASRFQAVFGEAPNANNIAQALASFQAIQFAPKNRVDEYKDGNLSALNASEKRGLLLFEGKARCSGCHAGKNYTDESFRNNGLADNGDLGRSEISGRNRDFKLFKVPSLRLVRLTAPYMHDGSIGSLRSVVGQYNESSSGAVSVDTDIRPLELSNEEINDLVNFLNVL